MDRDMILAVSELGAVVRRGNGAIVVHVVGHTLHVDQDALNAISAMLEEAVHSADTFGVGDQGDAH